MNKTKHKTKKCDFLYLAKERKTTYEFSTKKVKDSYINKILEAGRWSPSSHNCQPWSFIVIKDPKTIHKIFDVCYYGAFHHLPPVLIVVVLEPIYLEQKALLKGEVKGFVTSHKYLNIGFVTSNLIHEATSLDLMSCIISPIVISANKILKVSPEHEAIICVGFGYEREGSFQKPRERRKLKNMIYKEYYKKR